MGRHLLLALALVAALVAPALPADDELAEARMTFRSIVTRAVEEQQPPEGESLTKLVHDLTARDAEVVRRAESGEWSDPVSPKLEYRFAMERTIRFLHGLPERRDPGLIEFGDHEGFDVVAGAVLYRRSNGRSGSGPGLGVFDGPFLTLTGGAPVRRFDLPTPAALLAAEVAEGDGHDTPRWSNGGSGCVSGAPA